ncbi:MAG: TonB-dependent receptor [Pseudomonadales bacterium]|mgnify:FL=1|jgi:iron complex outermembrane receptor protein|tara:strand:+ start:1261 stop:3678 length:2418 start_codon:yes stop_codon:yes gene_type:complete
MNTKTQDYRTKPLCLAVVIAGLSLGQTALAQEQRESGASEILEELVVTARRREEGLQNAPIAISAYTGETLEYRGVTKLDEITRFVPNLTIENNPSFGGASNSAAIYIRGIGQKEFLPTSEPGVGLYVDGVYIARSVGAILDLIDIERLEVLRGPQGTLFGRNTIGGAINITTVTPEPGDEFGGEIGAAYGTDDRINLRGALNIPMGDTLAARVSVASFQQDGYVDRSDGIDLGDDDTITGRLAVAWRPSDRLSLDFRLDATRDKENGPAMELLGIDFTDLSQLNGLVAAVPPPMAFVHNITTAAVGPGQPCAATDAAGNGITSNPNSPNCYDNRYVGKDGKNDGTAPARSESDVLGLSADISYEINDNLTLRSITAWRDLDSEFARDGDHSPHRISQFQDTLEQTQFTQELQLLGTYERMNWIAGIYYFAEDGDNENTLDFTISNFRSGGEFDNKSMAAFAQLTYDFTDQLHLTVGGRYTDESKKFHPDQVIYQNYYAGISQVLPPGHPLAALDAPFLQAGTRILPDLEKELEINEFTPMVNLSYDFADNIMAYATYSEGFKSGGFTQRVFPPVIPPFTAPPGTPDIDLIPTYDPEFVDVYELGFKSTLLDGRMRFNGAIFHTDYDDLQVQVFDSVAPVTENIGSASIDGVELEMQTAPGDGWLVEASLSWLDAGYDEIGTDLTLIGSDNEFERVPEWASSVGVSKEFMLNEMGSLVVRVDWSYRDDTYNDAYNTEILKTDAYHLWDASVRWTNTQEDLSVILSGRNLGDEEFLVTGVYGTAFQSYEGIFDRGQQWLFEVRKNF